MVSIPCGLPAISKI